MKKAVILHGTDGTPEHNWFPWLKAQLQSRNYEVWLPLLPRNHTPDRNVYNDFLFESDWDLTDNLVIGHSSGAVSILNLLEDERCPHIETGVLVGAWSQMEDTDLDKEQFKNLFPPSGFKFDLIKQKVDQLLFLHGDDDPYCPVDQARWLAEKTESALIIIPGGGHLGQGAGYTQLPELIKALDNKQLL